MSKFRPKFTKIMQNCAKTSLFAYKTLVLLKKTVKYRRFNLWNCAVSGCVWTDPAWIWLFLCTFMNVVLWIDCFWAIFGTFGPYKGHFWTKPGPFGTSFWVVFWVLFLLFSFCCMCLTFIHMIINTDLFVQANQKRKGGNEREKREMKKKNEKWRERQREKIPRKKKSSKGAICDPIGIPRRSPMAFRAQTLHLAESTKNGGRIKEEY